MPTSKKWIVYFTINATKKRINWDLKPSISEQETGTILASLQAWQLAETSDGHNLIRAATRHARETGDPDYVEAVRLFIKEEQKHGNNLGRYIDMIGRKRIARDLGDTLFRKVRHLNTSMESWTLTVLVVESTAQIFYQSLKDATSCALLKEICTDILIDEARHIRFQKQRLSIIFEKKSWIAKWSCGKLYRLFFIMVSTVVWLAHRKVFRAGGNGYWRYIKKMNMKCKKTLPAPGPGPLTAGNRSFIRNVSFSPDWTRRP
ncbi:MAG TPA: ferritin-like domain-containing protein [Puia sp.]|nr:ferritin-like domain-containing protein [Puia sp.]